MNLDTPILGKVTTIEEAVEKHLRSGMRVMVGGFGRGGTPFTMLDFLAERPAQYSNLTIIKNDANEPNLGVGRLFEKGMVRSLISTHIGLNPDVIGQMNADEIDVELIPQGIFAEKIRARGAGIPAFLTDVGKDTSVAENKEMVEFNGNTYLLEEALSADVGLLCADRVDTLGNCWWKGSNRNMNLVMGTACDTVLVEALEIVNVGDIPPEDVQLPGVYVTAIVQALPRKHVSKEQKSVS